MATGNHITLADSLLAEVRAAATERNCGTEDIFEDAVKTYLDNRSWTKWLDTNREHTCSLGIKESDVDRLIAESRAENRSR